MANAGVNRFEFSHYAISHQGKVRKENQDAYGVFQCNNWSIYVVCDGMGGAKGGRIASSLCLEVLSKKLAEHTSLSLENLIDAISVANLVLFRFSKKEPDLQGMGTTLVLFASLESGYYSIHIGDSRLYRLKDKQLQILTRDHTYAQELIDSGTLSESSAKRSPISHLLTKAVGTEPKISPEIAKLEDLSDDDILLLSSDGLYAHLKRLDIENIVLDTINKRVIGTDAKVILEDVTNALIDETLSAGATDNTTVLTLKRSPYIEDNKSSEFTTSLSSASGIKFDLSDLNNDDFFIDPNQSSISQAILYSAHENSARSHNPSTNSSSLLASFLLGISSILGLALWLVISTEEQQTTRETRINAKLSSTIQQILQERNSKSINDRLNTINNPVLMDPLHAYGFTQEKYFEISKIPSKGPKITIDGNPLQEDQALAPIEWKEEQTLVDKLKSEPKELNATYNMDQLGPQELVDISNEKNILREALWDIDLRLTSLEISSPDLEERARAEIINQKNLIEEDLDFTKMALASIEKNYKSFLLYSKPNTIVELINNLKESIQNNKTLENLKQRYLSELQSVEFYTGLIKDSKNQLEIANRLATSNRKKQKLEALLKEELRNVTVEKIEVFNEHIAVLTLLKELLEIEDKRVSRALGFVGAYTSIGQGSRNSIWESLIQRRNELYSKYNKLEKSLPSEEEFKEQLRLIQKEQGTRP